MPQALPPYRRLPLTGPWLLAAAQAAQPGAERNHALFMALGGVSTGLRPLFWQLYGAARKRVLARSRPVAVLLAHDPAEGADLAARLRALKLNPQQACFPPWWRAAGLQAARGWRGQARHARISAGVRLLLDSGRAGDGGRGEGVSPTGGASLRVPRWVVLAFTVLLSVVFLGVAADYLKAEENYRTLRFESAHIGTNRIVTPAPRLRLLTQLEAFLQFARIEAKPGMMPAQVDWM